MRKLLGTIALVGAMWAGQAQAALLINIKGVFTDALYADPDPAPPLAFDVTFRMDYITSDGATQKRFVGETVSASVDGFDFTGVDISVADALAETIADKPDRVFNTFAFVSPDAGFGVSFNFAEATDIPRLVNASDSISLNQVTFRFGTKQYAGHEVTVAVEGSQPTEYPPSPPGIPEPATWAMMLAGFGLVGSAARRSRVPLKDDPAITARALSAS